MKKVKEVIFRYLTHADFFNINKPSGTEIGGGGQSYIDFPTSDISESDWGKFLGDVENISIDHRTQGLAWTTPIYSIGISSENDPQSVVVYQRRKTSISITAQKINSRSSNRILAWHPASGFPEPEDPSNPRQCPHGLVVYLVKTTDKQIWAGWFIYSEKAKLPSESLQIKNLLAPMLSKNAAEGLAGFFSIDDANISLNTTNKETPFSADTTTQKSKSLNIPAPLIEDKKSAYRNNKKTYSEDEIISTLFDEDGLATLPQETIERVVRIKKRNQKSTGLLKKLYGHTCQLTGTKFLFKKKDGIFYTEAHHLIPLGEGGADDPFNIVIISPLVHRMLHYADVSQINLSQIKTLDDGSAYLDIYINKELYRIRWHKEHAKNVKKSLTV